MLEQSGRWRCLGSTFAGCAAQKFAFCSARSQELAIDNLGPESGTFGDTLLVILCQWSRSLRCGSERRDLDDHLMTVQVEETGACSEFECMYN